MTPEQAQHYNILMQSKGSRQYLANVFDFNWTPFVSSYYGYRVHPISGLKNYHKGVDIGVPTGTEIRAGQDGVATTGYDAGGYGYYVTIENADGLVSKYAHCSELLVSNGQSVAIGDVIALVGSTGNSTGPHLHLEVLKNGQYLNPIYFADTGGAFADEIRYGDAGDPLSDGTYEALLSWGERYIGYPYVWGGSTPETSFDCSGFVCWIVNQSGAGSVGRTTAQGLYNLCTPVSPSEAAPGDLVFFTNTYSTIDTCTHVALYVGNGMMLHAGNPIGYASMNTPYWQSHFYSYGRISG
jgi:hypothetical protein